MKIFSLINIIVYSLLYVTNDIGNYGRWLIPVTILLYVVENMVYLYKYRRDQLLCFEFFFSIAFFLCSFLTPFVFPLLDSYQGRAFVDTEYNHIFYSGKSPLVNRTWKGIESCKYIRENI